MTWQAFLAANAWELVLLAVLLAGSAFFSGTETALFSLSRAQLHRLRHGGKLARLAPLLMLRPHRALNVLLLGNLVVATAYSAISAVMILELNQAGLPAWAAVLVCPLPVLLLVLLGEVSPKMLALALSERIAPAAAAVLSVVERPLRPLLWVLDAIFVVPLTRMICPRPLRHAEITAEELGKVLDLSAQRGLVGHDVNSLLRQIVELTAIRTADIMVPRVDVIAYDVQGPPEGLLELLRRTHLRKVPVYRGDLDHVLGVVHAKKLILNPGVPLEELTASIPFVPKAAKIERVLVQFRVTRTQMAVVVDEYGGAAGLITLHDILEEIVGTIPDPHDAQRGPKVQRTAPGQYIVHGDLPIHEWAEAFEANLAGQQISTVGGFVLSQLGRVPKAGDEVRYRNIRFTVLSMRGRRIETLRMEILEGRP